MDIISYILSRKYCDMSIVGLGSIRGANCTVKDIVHQDGINTVTFEWEGTDGTTKTRDMVVYDGTPIYVWESGNTYHYGDLAIYESQFYRCIVENNDATFDSTKWNEIGSPDGNYDIVQSVNLLPARFTAADRKLYYVIDENCFYLWNGTAWVKTISNKIADLDDVNLDDLTEGDVLVWDSVNEKWVNKAKFDEYKTAFTGTEEEWDALTSEEQNVYDIINITNDGDVLNLGIYLEKKTAMPVASEDVANRIYLYTGTTTQNYKKGVVYQCVSNGQTPTTYSWVALIDFGTAAIKNSTDRVLPNSTDLVESRSVYSAINNALSSIYTPRGDITCAELTSALLISDNIGNVYETSDSGTTTALFLQGAGHPIATGDNVGIINAGEGRILFNLMANAFDLTDYQKKDLASAIEGQTTVEGALGALSTNKADKVSSATNGNFAGLDASGNLTDSGKKPSDFQTVLTFDNVPTQNSNNPVKSGGVYSQIQTLTNRVKGNWSEGGKNLLPIKYSKITSYGLTWEKSNDGYIIINGTSTASPAQQSLFDATPVVLTSSQGTIISLKELGIDGTKKYIFSRDTKIENVRPRIDLWSDSAKLLEVELSNNDGLYKEIDFSQYPTCTGIKATIQVSLNTTVTNAIQKIMLCSKEWYDVDSTYQSYAKTNQQLTQDTTALLDNLEVNGAVNMLPITVSSQVINGVTYTVNADGTISAHTSGQTLTQKAELVQNVTLPSGIYKQTGCPRGGSDSTYRIGGFDGNDLGNGRLISSTGTTRQLYFTVFSGMNIPANNPIVFKPMITVPSYNGDYVPYAKSNKELTGDVAEIEENFANRFILTPRTKYYGVGNKTTLTISVPTSSPASNYMQGIVSLKGYSQKMVDCVVGFNLTNNNASVSSSKFIDHTGENNIALDSITVNGSKVEIVLSGIKEYTWIMAEYANTMSSTYENNTNVPEWTFT